MAKLNARTFSHRGDAEGHYLAVIDRMAADARYIDPTQAEVYLKKITEAREGGGELLAAEASELGVPLDVLINSVFQQYGKRQQWIQAIELDRVKAKAKVRKASTATEMHAALKAFKQQLTLLQ
ncbi:MAG: hypothetical protein JJT87_19135 [Halomonas sp.]|nr:hypothetical protein [Halomonas sp.]MCC5904030.1 hypothetical protein [Halomonas sp.]